MPLSPTPALKLKLAEAIKEFKSTIDSGSGISEENFRTEGMRRLTVAGDKFGEDVGDALDEWLEAVQLIILPGLNSVGMPGNVYSIIPYNNIEKL